jgi:CubicO group peptidase (beta-lactamase class C family)
MWQTVDRLLDEGLEQGLFAGVAMVVRTPEREAFFAARGQAELRPRRRPVRPDTAWDLASLTKVLGTTPLCLAMVGQGLLSLDAPVTDWIPDAPAGVTARHLLQHSSGLPAWAPLWQTIEAEGHTWGSAVARSRMSQLARSAPLEAPPGQRHRYSDLGFLLLGELLERAGGDRLDRLWERFVRAPAHLDLRWGWPEAAATEDCPARGQVVVGHVHDLNAAAMGGIAPHAGLFGSVRGVAAAVAVQLRSWAGEARVLEPALVQEAFSAQGPGSHRLGWDGVTPGACSAGPRWPLDGVGHLGFTGCSIWTAPRSGVAVVLLSNRVHPEIEGGAVPNAPLSPRYQAFRALRPALHTAVVDALEAEGALLT